MSGLSFSAAAAAAAFYCEGSASVQLLREVQLAYERKMSTLLMGSLIKGRSVHHMIEEGCVNCLYSLLQRGFDIKMASSLSPWEGKWLINNPENSKCAITVKCSVVNQRSLDSLSRQ